MRVALLCTSWLVTCVSSMEVLHNIEANSLFYYTLKRADYLTSIPDSRSNDPVTFRVSAAGSPDRPQWLRYLQRTQQSDAVLYGPLNPAHAGTTVLEVIGYNRRLYGTARHTIEFKVRNSTVPFPYQVELFLRNWQLERFMNGSSRTEFVNLLRRLWGLRPTVDLRILDAATPSDRGGRVPVPSAHAHAEGLYVRAGSPQSFPPQLVALRRQEIRDTCRRGDTPRLDVDLRLRAVGMEVDWCRSQLLDVPAEASAARGWGGAAVPAERWTGLEELGEFSPPDAVAAPAAARHLARDFALALGVPCGAALLASLVLAHVMCCRREGRSKRDKQTPSMQLLRYQGIKQATLELRNLSYQRAQVAPVATRLGFDPLRHGHPSARGAHVPLVYHQQ
ncbi:epsilon-sarcoglycan-like isoform X1 [Petromyzon marinus]|uniref:Epsilon-sarcoglycan-like isoform X1 n=2 Tax=Petromyzon marinus TaxID=7757 RepID=A0AAJ7U803_PETMA|nr:epsilon-sarcoglycan-like isoform X1 [Petromyzon marinus]